MIQTGNAWVDVDHEKADSLGNKTRKREAVRISSQNEAVVAAQLGYTPDDLRASSNVKQKIDY